MKTLSRLLDRARDRPVTAIAAVVALLGVAVLVLVLSPTDDGRRPGHEASTSAATPQRRPAAAPAAPRPDRARKPASARAVAAGFLDGYLAYSYGRGSLSAIRGADPRFMAVLGRERPRVPPGVAGREPKVTSLQLLEQARGAMQATVTVSDGDGADYALIAYLDRHPNGWVVTRLGDD